MKSNELDENEKHPRKLLTFSEFVNGGTNSNGESKIKLAEEVQRPKPPAKVSLPAQLTFRRVELRTFSNSKVVGLYREPTLGFEIVFPLQFER